MRSEAPSALEWAGTVDYKLRSQPLHVRRKVGRLEVESGTFHLRIDSSGIGIAPGRDDIDVGIGGKGPTDAGAEVSIAADYDCSHRKGTTESPSISA